MVLKCSYFGALRDYGRHTGHLLNDLKKGHQIYLLGESVHVCVSVHV